MKDKMLEMINARIRKAHQEHYQHQLISHSEYVILAAELIGIRQQIEMMEG